MEKKNLQNFNEIKLRILQFIESQGLPKGKFFEKISIRPSNFAGINAESALNSDNIVKILTEFPQLNPDWLLLGKGAIFRQKYTQNREPVASSAPTGDLVSLEKYAALIRENERLRLELEAVKAAASARLDGDGGGTPLFTTFQSTDRT